MYLKHLWYLHLVVTEGSFAAAARAANVSQPAITLAMRALEQEWGTPLFEKAGRQKRPTRAAVAAAKRAAELHGQLTTLSRQEVTLQEWLDDALPSSLRIGLAPAAALLYGPIIESTWRRHEPEGLLRIVSGSAPEVLLDLQRGDLDLAVLPRPRRYEATDLNCHALHHSTPAIYARHENLWVRRRRSWKSDMRAGPLPGVRGLQAMSSKRRIGCASCRLLASLSSVPTI